MYQPYIRGKQFELIGIRELIPDVLLPNKDKISPIIEPVKDSSTLKNTLKSLVQSDINFTFIINPQVGTFTDTVKILNILKDCIGGYLNFQIGIIFHDKINHQYLIDLLHKFRSNISLSLIHNTIFDDINAIIDLYNDNGFSIKYNIINLSLTSKRYFRNFEKGTCIELDDYFNNQPKNSDYAKIKNSIFSEEHLYYREEGFVGFSDYLSIGKDYSETGFLPYAVAIHLSYTDSSKKINIRHFVSDSNDDNSDIGGKFAEALEKLIHWCNKTGYNSIAIPIFREYYCNGHFPGLGTLKKLSLMNHIDLVSKLI
ncbi:sce7725 family protein [Capnocytophaga canimorsus]|uniref:sce7725 family protein n=1 Tax=Capnocytophaga canimorsus TaxID=28188 RepID=UPI0037D7EFA4